MSYRILVPLDGSKLAESAIPIAADLVRRATGSLRLVRVHVPIVPLASAGDLSAPFYNPAWDDQMRELETGYLAGVAARARTEFGGDVSTALPDGANVVEQIEHCAAEFAANLILMTTHGRGGSSLAWIGSVADGVVRHTHRLMMVVPDRATESALNVRRVLVALDGSAAAEAAMDSAVEIAGLFQAELALVRVVAPPLLGDALTAMSSEGLDRFGVDLVAEAAKEELDAIARRLRVTGLTVNSMVIVHANPARALLQHVAQYSPDVIAMGTHGRGFSRLFVGSVMDKVLRGSGRPTLIRRPAPDLSG